MSASTLFRSKRSSAGEFRPRRSTRRTPADEADGAMSLPSPLQAENQRLRRAVDELSVLNELAREIGSSHDSKRVLEHIVKAGLRADSPADDPRFRGDAFHPGITSCISVPLMAQSRLFGMLTIYNKKDGGGFTEHDQRLLATLASQSAQKATAAERDRTEHRRCRD